MTPSTITDAVFGADRDPAGPLLTFYDDATGERTELSTLTTANWAAKTANYLRDEAGSAVGDTVAVDLPAHWQTFVILLGSWWAGARVVIGADEDAGVAFCSAGSIDAHDGADELVVAPLDPFAGPVPGLPTGVADFGGAVRIHGDQFAPIVPGTLAVGGRTTETVVADAIERATAAGIGRGDRVLSTRSWGTSDEVIANVLATVVVGGSLVQVRNADPARVADRARSENVTVTLD